MKKLNLADYTINVQQVDGSVKAEPFPVRVNLVEVLFHPDLQLGGREVLKRDKLANAILEAPEDSILLEEEDYHRLVEAVDIVKGFTYHAIELLKRIYEAPEVTVKEA